MDKNEVREKIVDIISNNQWHEGHKADLILALIPTPETLGEEEIYQIIEPVFLHFATNTFLAEKMKNSSRWLAVTLANKIPKPTEPEKEYCVCGYNGLCTENDSNCPKEPHCGCCGKPKKSDECWCGAVATEHCPVHGIIGELQMGKPLPPKKGLPEKIEELKYTDDGKRVIDTINELIRHSNHTSGE